MPVVFGPKYAKFKEANDLIELGGADSISDASGCAAVLDKYLSSASSIKKAGDTAGAYIRRNIGATDKIYNDLFSSQ